MRPPRISIILSILFYGCCVVSIWAQQPPVTMQIEVAKRVAGNPGTTSSLEDASTVAVWLSPLNHALP